jgi:O-antigen/teichoic acid export membrane protein
MDRSEQRTATAVTKLATSSAALLFASVAGNALSYVFGVFVARILGVEQFGLYALGLTIFNLLVLFAPLGLDIGVIKFASGYLTAGETCRARRMIFNAGVIAIASGLVTGIGLMLFAPLLSASLYHKPELSGVLLFFSFALPFAVLTTVLLGSLQAFQTVRYTIWIKYVWEPAGKFLLAALAVVLGLGLYGVVGSIVIVLAVSAFITFRCLMRVMPRNGSRSDPGIGPYRELMAFSLPLVVSNLFSVLAPRSDMLILGYWVDAKQLGIYNAAFQTSAIIALVLGAFDTAVAPIVGSLISRGDTGSLKTLYHATSRWSLTVAAAICVLLVIWGREILALFGPAFTLGLPCLLILAAAQLLNASAGATSSMILMSGHSRMIMTNSVIVGLLLIGTNLVVIPRYGIVGAAVASSACQIVVSIIRMAQVWHLQRILPFSRSMVKPVGAAAIATAVGWVARGELVGGPVSQLVLALFVLGIFACILLLFGFEETDSVTAFGLWNKLTMRRS